MNNGLKILVPVKRVLDYALKPRVKNNAIDISRMKQSLNPFDELAVEEAVRLRERYTKKQSPAPVDEIVAFTAGPTKAQDVLRTALAMGADRAIHVQTEDSDDDLEPLVVAKLLKQVAYEEQINLIIMGKQSISDDSGQTGSMLAALLGWSQATQIAHLAFTDPNTAQITREVDGGVDTVTAALPLLLTTDLRLNEPRYATLPNIMKAKKKPVLKKFAVEYGVNPAPRLIHIKVKEPSSRQAGVKVDSVDAMISKLKQLGAL